MSEPHKLLLPRQSKDELQFLTKLTLNVLVKWG